MRGVLCVGAPRVGVETDVDVKVRMRDCDIMHGCVPAVREADCEECVESCEGWCGDWDEVAGEVVVPDGGEGGGGGRGVEGPCADAVVDLEDVHAGLLGELDDAVLGVGALRETLQVDPGGGGSGGGGVCVPEGCESGLEELVTGVGVDGGHEVGGGGGGVGTEAEADHVGYAGGGWIHEKVHAGLGRVHVGFGWVCGEVHDRFKPVDQCCMIAERMYDDGCVRWSEVASNRLPVMRIQQGRLNMQFMKIRAEITCHSSRRGILVQAKGASWAESDREK